VYSFIVEVINEDTVCQNPKFYADFEGNSGKGVQRYRRKYLNFRRILQGVIIDLMDNGGGSMDEATSRNVYRLGPISVILDNKGANHYKRPLSRNDLQRSDSDIDKRNSASASEFFLLHCKTTIEHC
jgi:carboxyl-terminal processing protease